VNRDRGYGVLDVMVFAHAGHWLEPLMFAPAFAVVLWAIVRSRS
jgi:hypothetical protein